jgi:putative Mg2+ transporter-C (MgtC) family protein
MDAEVLGLAGRLALAIALGAVIGIEREADGHPAGLRTHITVALGAALFGWVSVDGFDRFVAERATTNMQVDVTRVASQVVVGIGFLGAGTIVKNKGSVRGLTTAASLWVASAVGLAVGIGAPLAATFTTIGLVLTLVGLKFPRRWVRQYVSTRRRTLTLRLTDDADAGAILSHLEQIRLVEVRNVTVRRTDGGRAIEVEIKPLPGGDVEGAIDDMESMDGVDGLELE